MSADFLDGCFLTLGNNFTFVMCSAHFSTERKGTMGVLLQFSPNNNGFSFFGLTKLVINLPRTYDKLSCQGKQYWSAIFFSTNKQRERDR